MLGRNNVIVNARALTSKITHVTMIKEVFGALFVLLVGDRMDGGRIIIRGGGGTNIISINAIHYSFVRGFPLHAWS